MPQPTCLIQSIVVSVTSLLLVSLHSGCQAWRINPPVDRIEPSNQRDWTPEFSKLPVAEIEGSHISLHNIRNCHYVTEEDFVIEYYDRDFDLSQVKSVDFIVVPFKNEALAHTMLSFCLDDESYLAVSVEIRTEKGENYHPLLGLARQYEITYVLADEKDLIRLRTAHRDADVYVYPTVASPEQAQLLLVDVLQRMNQLVEQPEFYHALSNNCTTNLARHVNQISPDRIPYNWKVLLPGFSAEYAYELGLLDNSVPFADLKSLAFVNHRVARHFYAPDFSQQIRGGREQLAQRLEERGRWRQAALAGPGSDYLEQSTRPIRKPDPVRRPITR